MPPDATPPPPCDAAPDDLRWAIDALRPPVGAREIAVAAYFDPEWRILGRDEHGCAATDHVFPPIRAIVRDALRRDARYLLIAHNHPSGDPRPSADDLAYTRLLARTLRAIDMVLVDHIIVTISATASFRQLGLL